MPEFKISPARPMPGSPASSSYSIVGTGGVVSRTPVHGNPGMEVIHGAYAEGTYVVMGPRRPSPPRRQAVRVRVRHPAQVEVDALRAGDAWQRVLAKRSWADNSQDDNQDDSQDDAQARVYTSVIR